MRTLVAAFWRETLTTRPFGASKPGSYFQPGTVILVSSRSSLSSQNILTILIILMMIRDFIKTRALTEQVLVDDVEADEEGSRVLISPFYNHLNLVLVILINN